MNESVIAGSVMIHTARAAAAGAVSAYATGVGSAMIHLHPCLARWGALPRHINLLQTRVSTAQSEMKLMIQLRLMMDIDIGRDELLSTTKRSSRCTGYREHSLVGMSASKDAAGQQKRSRDGTEFRSKNKSN